MGVMPGCCSASCATCTRPAQGVTAAHQNSTSAAATQFVHTKAAHRRCMHLAPRRHSDHSRWQQQSAGKAVCTFRQSSSQVPCTLKRRTPAACAVASTSLILSPIRGSCADMVIDVMSGATSFKPCPPNMLRAQYGRSEHIKRVVHAQTGWRTTHMEMAMGVEQVHLRGQDKANVGFDLGCCQASTDAQKHAAGCGSRTCHA